MGQTAGGPADDASVWSASEAPEAGMDGGAEATWATGGDPAAQEADGGGWDRNQGCGWRAGLGWGDQSCAATEPWRLLGLLPRAPWRAKSQAHTYTIPGPRRVGTPTRWWRGRSRKSPKMSMAS